MIEYGYTSYEKMKPVKNCVLIKKLEEKDLRKSHGLFIPYSKKYENDKIGVGLVLDLGEKAAKETGVKAGDYVLYDYYSAFNDLASNILTNYENLFMVLTKDEAEAFLNGNL